MFTAREDMYIKLIDYPKIYNRMDEQCQKADKVKSTLKLVKKPIRIRVRLEALYWLLVVKVAIYQRDKRTS